MLIMQNTDGKEVRAKKWKDMSTESYDFSDHRTKSGSIDGKSYTFHHYNYGSKFYFKLKENSRWYQVVCHDNNLNFTITGRVRE